MKHKKYISTTESNAAATIAVSTLTSITVTVILAAVLAFFMNTEKISEESIGYAGMAILLVSSFLGAITAERNSNINRFAAVYISGGAYFLILICITALFFDGMYYGVWVNLLMILCGSSMVIILKKPSYKTGKGRGTGKRSGKVVQKRHMGK